MSVIVNLAASGVVGVSDLSVGQLIGGTPAVLLEVNTAYVATGSGISTYMLPDGLTDPNIDLAGSVIKFKNLLDETSPMVTDEITIQRNGGMIDGRADDWVTTVANDFVTFVWINDNIGWAAL